VSDTFFSHCVAKKWDVRHRFLLPSTAFVFVLLNLPPKALRLPFTVEQRKTRRFTLQLPVSLTRAGNIQLSDSGFTKNISSCGVLFTAQRELDVGGPIEYVITLIDESSHPVNIKCVGKVVRLVNGPDRPPTVAATVERYEFLRPSDD